MAESGGERKRWLALESNPEVLTAFAKKLGLKEGWAFCDIFGLDDDCLAWVPSPCKSVVFLFPSKRKNYTGESVVSQTTVEGSSSDAGPDCKGAFYLTQIKELGNACGTIAVIHSIANNRDLLESGSALEQYLDAEKDSSPLTRGNALNECDAIQELHNSCAHEGQTEVIADKVCYHFVCFTEVGGRLFELDGCNPSGPVDHGEVGEQGLLKAAAALIRKLYVEANPDQVDFSMAALAAAQ
eukprot:TRINITY_DN1179_c0_g1_i1.p1 TRINITY_DN1179_c0_g1~~TRINITY_DN1179_c0_g1_i1.p1  ORF type:complete len:258 (-),score=80.73 TRINITY_DN1179_c0_g1_i1:161-883(-)